MYPYILYLRQDCMPHELGSACAPRPCRQPSAAGADCPVPADNVLLVGYSRVLLSISIVVLPVVALTSIAVKTYGGGKSMPS